MHRRDCGTATASMPSASGVPLNMLSKWMGHSTLEVTAIYANATGAEEQGIAARMWR